MVDTCQPSLPIHLTLSVPPRHSYICSLCLCLHFCFVNKIICTIFLDYHIISILKIWKLKKLNNIAKVTVWINTHVLCLSFSCFSFLSLLSLSFYLISFCFYSLPLSFSDSLCLSTLLSLFLAASFVLSHSIFLLVVLTLFLSLSSFISLFSYNEIPLMATKIRRNLSPLCLVPW